MDKTKISRMEAIKARAERKGRVPDFGLPDLAPGEYMVGVMMDLGPMRRNGEAPEATDWPVITPYAESIGLDTEDAMILARMCRGYFTAWSEGKNPLAIAPVEREEKE